jgi:Na+/H+ antiporter NhaD/arsenite permease-like protein
MVLIRPLLRANAWRARRAHVVIFFIFLVANIGGSLSPLGDPPLFLGFLKGVPFFWPTVHMLAPMLLCAGILLVVFFALDSWMMRGDGPPPASRSSGIRIEGALNFALLAGVVGAVLMSGTWRPGMVLTVYHVDVPLEGLVRDLLLLLLALASWLLTPPAIRQANEFSWFPIVEVAKLFAGIFVTIVPAIAILRAGTGGAMAMVIDAVSTADGQPLNVMYFWLTGILSSFLDNAPTYLVFFNTAGGDPAVLSGAMAPTLLAISAGAVFMGANTYIGNAPNFMVRAIAEESGLKMPSFFGYMGWSCAFLLPVFALLTLVFFV